MALENLVEMRFNFLFDMVVRLHHSLHQHFQRCTVWNMAITGLLDSATRGGSGKPARTLLSNPYPIIRIPTGNFFSASISIFSEAPQQI